MCAAFIAQHQISFRCPASLSGLVPCIFLNFRTTTDDITINSLSVSINDAIDKAFLVVILFTMKRNENVSEFSNFICSDYYFLYPSVN